MIKSTLKIFLIICMILQISCNKKEKTLILEEKKIQAIEFVDSFLLDGYKKLDIPIYLQGQDVDFVEPYTYSDLRKDYFDLLYYVENFDSLSIVYGNEYVMDAIEIKQKKLIFLKTFKGFEIHKNFHLYERVSPIIIQVFWIDLNLKLRAQSTLRFTEMYPDTIDGEPTYFYVDTSKYIGYLGIWN